MGRLFDQAMVPRMHFSVINCYLDGVSVVGKLLDRMYVLIRFKFYLNAWVTGAQRQSSVCVWVRLSCSDTCSSETLSSGPDEGVESRAGFGTRLNV